MPQYSTQTFDMYDSRNATEYIILQVLLHCNEGSSCVLATIMKMNNNTKNLFNVMVKCNHLHGLTIDSKSHAKILRRWNLFLFNISRRRQEGVN